MMHWAVIGPSSSGKTAFLDILRGRHLCFPPNARSFPYLSTDEIERKDHRLRVPDRALQYVGFSGEQHGLSGPDTRGAYLSARYESRREDSDFSLFDYLSGHTQLNALEEQPIGHGDELLLSRVIEDLNLGKLVGLPVGNLSNGQTRRARIAKALLGRPEVLLLDEPFMGLDPLTSNALSPLLHRLASASAPRFVLSLRPQDKIPSWITHLTYLTSGCKVVGQGPKIAVLDHVDSLTNSHDGPRTLPTQSVVRPPQRSGEAGIDPVSQRDDSTDEADKREALVEMAGVRVKYGDREVLGCWQAKVADEQKEGLWWTVRRGERWGIFGPNGTHSSHELGSKLADMGLFQGSGKTTIISLICSDHPQTYSLPIRLFGQSRLPQRGQPGITIFDIQARIGHSSPEVHAFFPRHLSVRKTLENAWADTFLGRPKLTQERIERVEAGLRWFAPDLSSSATALAEQAQKHGSTESSTLTWADTLRFSDLPFSAQRLALFLRALIKVPDILILDEAFSGMDAQLRDKCMAFLEYGTDVPIEASQSRTQQGDGAVREMQTAHVQGLGSNQALICVSHVKEEVPGIVREWMCLPEADEGKSARSGRWDGPMEEEPGRWEKIWEL
ncbi:MAG: hypothetical protein M1833_005659 [Piccolia ochrophora]|nr:MAG: hypothetical protein M1833_005659 [Piccolia ochrophora]